MYKGVYSFPFYQKAYLSLYEKISLCPLYQWSSKLLTDFSYNKFQAIIGFI